MQSFKVLTHDLFNGLVGKSLSVPYFMLSMLPKGQPRSQGLSSSRPSKRGETLVGSGHASPRIWEMTTTSLKGGAS